MVRARFSLGTADAFAQDQPFLWSVVQRVLGRAPIATGDAARADTAHGERSVRVRERVEIASTQGHRVSDFEVRLRSARRTWRQAGGVRDRTR